MKNVFGRNAIFNGIAGLLIVAFMLLGQMGAMGATKTATVTSSGGTTLWSSLVWSPSAPVAGDDVVINLNVSGGGNHTISSIGVVPATGSFLSFTVQGTGTGTLNLTGAGTGSIFTNRIAINNNTAMAGVSFAGSSLNSNTSVVAANKTFTIGTSSTSTASTVTSTLLISAGILTVNGTMVLANGAVTNTTNSRLVIANGGTFNINKAITSGNTTFPNLTCNLGGTVISTTASSHQHYLSSMSMAGTFVVSGQANISGTSGASIVYTSTGKLEYNLTGTSNTTVTVREWPTTSGPASVDITSNSTRSATLSASRSLSGTLTLTSGVFILSGSSTELEFTTPAGTAPIVRTSGTFTTSSYPSLDFNPASGTGNWTIPGGTFTSDPTFSNLSVDMPSGNSLILNDQDITVRLAISLTSGFIKLGSGDLLHGASGTTQTLTLTPSSSRMIITSSTSGYYMRYFAYRTSGSETLAFPIGDDVSGNDYSPVSLTLTTNASARYFGFRTVDGVHPSNGNPTTPAAYITRYWETKLSSTSSYDYSATFTYASTGDVVGTESSIKPMVWQGSAPWLIYSGSTINTTNKTLNISGDETAASRLAASTSTGYAITGRADAVAPNLVVDAILPDNSTTACNVNTMDYLVEIRNNGTQDIAPGTPVSVTAYYGPTCGGSAVTSGNITTGIAAGSSELIILTVSGMPNGEVSFSVDASNTITEQDEADNCLSDNTVTLGGISGTFTVGGTSPDFATPAAAAAALANGVCGPVVFNVRQGTYTEQVVINTVSGTSAINTVTFQPDPANTADVNIEYGTQTSAANCVLCINGASYIRVNGLKFLALSSGSYRGVVYLGGNTNDLVFDGNTFETTAGISNANYKLFFTGTSTTDLNYNTVIRNNNFIGGSEAIELNGSSSAYVTGNVVENNTITNVYGIGIIFSYQNGVTIQGNVIDNGSNTGTVTGIDISYITGAATIANNQITISTTGNGEGISATSVAGASVTQNIIEVTGSSGTKYGIVFLNVDGTSGSHVLVANNFVVATSNVSTTVYGISLSNCDYNDVVFNNFYTSGASSSSHRTVNQSGGGNIVFKNNNVATANTGYAMYTTNSMTTDYNNFHYTASGNFGYRSGNVADFATWSAISGVDNNSIAQDPQYTSLASPYDLHVANAVLAGAGQHFPSVTTDIDNQTRQNPPYIGADEAAPAVANDASVVSIVSPAAPVCGGTTAVQIEVANYGNNNLTSVTINWTVNGVAQTPVNITGLNIAKNNSATVSLGNYTLAASTSYTFAFSSTSPNGATDGVPANDSYSAPTFTTSLAAGTYTIGGTSPNYATFADALNALSNGVCGPVVFNVRQGTYNAQVSVPVITGASATNTITFQADPANSTAAILQSNSQSSSANYVLQINGASYLRFYGLTIRTTNSGTYRGVIHFTGNTDNVIIDGNSIEAPASSSGISQKLLYMDNVGNINNNNTIANNTFIGGYTAIEIPGSSSNYETGNVVNGNTISDFYYRGIDISYQTDIVANDNIITAYPSNASVAGIETYQCQNSFSIQRNKIEITGTTGAKTGIIINQTNNTSGNRGLVANNFITAIAASSTVNGINATYGRYLDIAFNNIYTSGTSTSSHASFNYGTGGNDVRFYNNNVVTEGAGYAMDVTNAVTSDYNNFHYTSSGPNFGKYHNTNYSSFALWKSGSGQDANSITVNPQYTATIAPFDLHATNTAINGEGTAFGGITTDIDGNSRPTPPSIGANEVAPPVTVSVWTGNVSTDWFDNGNWTAGVPTLILDGTIPNVSTGSNRYPILTSIGGIYGEVKDLDIASGASVTLPAGTRIEIAGDLINNGSATFGGGTLRFIAGNTHSISGNVTVGILTIEAATTLSGNASVTEALNLVTGNLNTTGGTLRLKSNATTTAYIDDFSAGYTGSITGNVTVERYVANPANGFHYVGAPVNGSTITDWAGEFAITGPNNAQVVPQVSCDPNALAQGSPYGGLFEYRENAVTSCYQSGWFVRSGNGTIDRTKGYAGIIPHGTTVDLSGTANTGSISSQALSYTNANGTSTKGMHLVSNPYPSALDWYAVRTANPDVDGTAYLWETSGSYLGTYQQINGLTPGTSFIGSSQGFFVQANSSGTATLDFNNGMRVTGNNSFFRQGQAFDSRLILEVSGNGYNDRTIVAFGSDFTDGYESGFDSKKMQSKGGVMTLYTHTNSALPRQATNALPNDRSVKVVPVGFAAGATGTFTFTADDLATFGVGAMVYLEDLKTGAMQNLMVNPTYTFNSDVNDPEARFLLHFIPSIEWNTVSATCTGTDGSLVVDLGASEMNGNLITWDAYEIINDNGQQVTAGTNANGTINLSNLAPGTYTVTLEHDGYVVTQDITVSGVALVDAAAVASDTEVLEGETITFSNGSNGATSYEWNFGDGGTSTDASPAYSYAAEGIYTVTLTATNGTCTDVFTQTIAVNKEQGPTGIGNVDEANGITIFGYGKTVTVRFDKWADAIVTLDLYDLTGRKVITTTTLSTAQAQHRLNINEVVSGYYFVRVQGASGSKVTRVFLGE